MTMPWYAIVYFVVLMGLGVYSAYDDLKDRVSPVYVLVDAMVTILWLYFLVAYSVPGIALTGLLLAAMFAFGIVWTTVDVHRELQQAVRHRPLGYDSEVSAETNLRVDRGVEGFAVLFGVALGAPAIAAAAVVVKRAIW